MKKILLSLGLILALVFSLAMPTVMADGEEATCTHENKFVGFVGQEPSDCSETGVAKYVCIKCDQVFFEAQSGEHDLEWSVSEATCGETCDCEGKDEEGFFCQEESHAKPRLLKAVCKKCKKVTLAQPEGAADTCVEATKSVEASCARSAGTVTYCEVCDREIKFVATDGSKKLDHVAVKKTLEATCKAAGYDYYECKNCGAKEGDAKLPGEGDAPATDVKLGKIAGSDKDVNPNAHVTKPLAVLQAATCKKDGIQKAQCTLCDSVVYETIAKQHTWQYTAYEGKEATCGKDGEGFRVCTTCEKIEEEVVIPATGAHNYVFDIKEATCETGEIAGLICTLCGEAKEGEYTTTKPALGHVWGAPSLVAATCEKPNGSKEICITCGTVEITYFDAVKDADIYQAPLAHTINEPGDAWKEILHLEGNCTEKEYTVTKCELCNKEVVTEGELDSTNHPKKLVSELRPATCTASGIGKFVCEKCDKDLGYGVIEAKHDWNETIPYDGKLPTCAKEDGEGLGYRTCKICDVKEENVVIPALTTHTMAELEIQFDCTKGYGTGLVCEVCNFLGEVTWTGETAAHVWGPEALYDATCDASNGTIKVCQVCEKEEKTPFTSSMTGIYKAPLNHKSNGKDQRKTTINIKATCVTAAYKETECALCGLVEKFPGKINESNHNKKISTTLRPATCTEDGVGRFYCVDCNADLGYGVIPSSHDFDAPVAYEGQEATCAEPGLGIATCKVCGYEDKEYVIKATGKHDYKNVTVDAKCGSEGHKKYTVSQCEICGKENGNRTYSGSVPACKTVEQVVEPTCTTNRGIAYICSVCGEETKPFLEFEKGHPLWVEGVDGHEMLATDTVVAPTCQTEGYTVYECADCGETEKREITSPVETNHVKKLVLTLQAGTCAKSGIGRFVCAEEECGMDLGIMAIVVEHEIVPAYTTKPTCNTAGKGSVSCANCTVFKKVTDAQNKEDYKHFFEATGEHTWLEGIKEADCNNPAYFCTYCTVCGKIDTTKVHEAVIGSEPTHSWGTEKYEAATCTTDGRIVIKCTVKGCKADPIIQIIKDSKGEIAEPRLGHKMELTVVPATCSKPGYTIDKCKTCGFESGDPVEGSETPKNPNNHTTKVLKVLREATCTLPGIAKVECTDSKCDYKVQNNGTKWTGYEVIEAGHDYDEENDKATGIVVYHVCKGCQTVKVAQVVLAASETDPVKLAIAKEIKVGNLFESIVDLQEKLAEIEIANTPLA